jgi:hypothetical protein
MTTEEKVKDPIEALNIHVKRLLMENKLEDDIFLDGRESVDSGPVVWITFEILLFHILTYFKSNSGTEDIQVRNTILHWTPQKKYATRSKVLSSY